MSTGLPLHCKSWGGCQSGNLHVNQKKFVSWHHTCISQIQSSVVQGLQGPGWLKKHALEGTLSLFSPGGGGPAVLGPCNIPKSGDVRSLLVAAAGAAVHVAAAAGILPGVRL